MDAAEAETMFYPAKTKPAGCVCACVCVCSDGERWPLLKKQNVLGPLSSPRPDGEPHVAGSGQGHLWRAALPQALGSLQARGGLVLTHSGPILQATHTAFQELLLAGQE